MKKYFKELKERIRDSQQIKQELEMARVYSGMFKYSQLLQLMVQRVVAKRLIRNS